MLLTNSALAMLCNSAVNSAILSPFTCTDCLQQGYEFKQWLLILAMAMTLSNGFDFKHWLQLDAMAMILIMLSIWH